jgi:hypothetical protein
MSTNFSETTRPIGNGARRANGGARRSTYDPGAPRGIRRTGETTFDVESFLRDGIVHENVDLADRSCSCEHYEFRVGPARRRDIEIDDCKHVLFADEYAAKLEFINQHTMIEPATGEIVTAAIEVTPPTTIDPLFRSVADPDPRDYDPFAGLPSCSDRSANAQIGDDEVPASKPLVWILVNHPIRPNAADPEDLMLRRRMARAA